MKRINLGKNWNGSETIIDVSDDELISRDVRPAKQVQNILDNNKQMRSLGRAPNKSAHGRLVASIPLEIFAEWKKDYAANFKDTKKWEDYIKVKLNDPDNKFLRTNEMHL